MELNQHQQITRDSHGTVHRTPTAEYDRPSHN